MSHATMKKITTFSFKKGDIIARKYSIVERIGKGYEGEVYLVKEKNTGVKRAMKIYFPHRNKGNKALTFSARTLDRLKHCQIVTQYHTEDSFEYNERKVHFSVSEFVDGEMLSTYIKYQTGKRLPMYQALHLLYALVKGLEDIHEKKRYHGDIHVDNIMIETFGITCKMKLIDVFNWDNQSTRSQNIQEDIVQAIQLFYDVIGGSTWFKKLPDDVREMCCGMKRTKILKKFRSMRALRNYIEKIEIW